MTTSNGIINIGRDAGYSGNTGIYNINIGYRAGYSCTWNHGNVSIGARALDANTGGYNTALGYFAGLSYSNYNYCTFLGHFADATGSYSNAVAIGNNSRVSSSNWVRVGNTSITRIEGQVPWTSTSDGRVKENVVEDVAGIDFIMRLRPVTFNFNKDKQDEILGRPDSAEYKGKYNIEDIRFSGFIAQEVEVAASEVGYDFSGVKKPAHNKDLYGLTYSEFVVPLVKATQEQQLIIEEQNQKIQQPEQQMQEQNAIINMLIQQNLEIQQQINEKQ